MRLFLRRIVLRRRWRAEEAEALRAIEVLSGRAEALAAAVPLSPAGTPPVAVPYARVLLRRARDEVDVDPRRALATAREGISMCDDLLSSDWLEPQGAPSS